MLPFGKVGTHKWVVFKAIMCAAASCGFRLDEVTDWKFVDGSNIVTSSGSLQDTFLYLLVSHSAPIVRAQDKGARIFGVGCCVAIRLLNFSDG